MRLATKSGGPFSPLGGLAVVFALTASSGAQALPCTQNSPAFGAPFNNVTLGDFIPFSQGSAINSLVSVIDTANTAFFSGTTAFTGAPGSPQPNQPAGGIWTRGIVGTATYDNTSASTITGTVGAANVNGSVACASTTKQDFAGFQMGRDIAQLNFDKSGWNLHWGLTAGWFEADARDTSGGTFTGQTWVPFAGFYGVATNGGFFSDVQVRWDYFDNQINDPANGLVDQHLNAEGIAVAGNVGYRHDFVAPDRSKWFVEPSLGLVWSDTSVDPLSLPGTQISNPTPGGPGGSFTPNRVSDPGTIQISDIESILGRASLRVGTNFVSNNVAWQPFATASIYREFAGNVTTTTTTRPDQLPNPPFLPGFPALTSNQTTSRVGTYGQFALGLAGQIIDTGWLGYARVDYRTGENIEGVSGNLGLRYQFNPGPALPSLKGGPAPVLYAYNWTGFYAGGFGGALFARQETLAPAFGTTNTIKAEGYLLGGRAGYNYQTGPWVIGVEADIGGSNAEGGHSCPNGFFFTCHVEVDDLASVTGRLGYAWERALFYVKGGLAIGEVVADATPNAPNTPVFINPTPIHTSNTQTGWIIGTGAEFALTQNWSAKGEWMYYDLGSDTFVTDSAGNVVTADTTAKLLRWA